MLKVGIAVELVALSAAIAVGGWGNSLSTFIITCLGLLGLGLILIGVLTNDQRTY